METTFWPLAHSLFRCELDPGILQFIPGNVEMVTPIHKRLFLAETSLGNLALWITAGPEKNLFFQDKLFELCKQHNLIGFLYPIELTNNSTYAQLNEKQWLYVTPWPSFTPISYRNINNLKSLIKLMCQFCEAVSSIDGLNRISEQLDDFDLFYQVNEMQRNFKIFKMLAENRLKPTAFDGIFLKYYQKIKSDIERAMCHCKKVNCFLGKANKRIIINNYSRSNLRVFQSDVYCLQLKYCRRSLPVFDLGALMVKSGRSHLWSLSWFKQLVQEFEKYYQLSELDIDLLKAYLICPWEFYRLMSRYYYNRVDWANTRFVQKIERLVYYETYRDKFIQCLI